MTDSRRNRSTKVVKMARRKGFHFSAPLRSVTRSLLPLCLCAAGAQVAAGQALPAATASPVSTGFQLPTAAGSIQYSIGAMESLSSGYYGSGWDTAPGVNGNVAMITNSKKYPFSMIFSGGYFWSTSQEPTNSYADLGVSQVINTKNWSFLFNDAVSYFPSTPSVGLSGMPGTGDLGVPPVQLGINNMQGLLTQYSNRVSNSASLNISRHITGRLSAQGSASYMIMRFLGNPGVSNSSPYNAAYGDGLDSDAYTGGGGLSYILNGRDTLTASYEYSTYAYKSNYPGFSSQTAMAGFTHQFSRRLSMDLFAGPQWSTSQQVTGPYQVVLPGSPSITTLSAYVNSDLNYSTKNAHYSLDYSRGTNAGFGVIAGGETDNVSVTASTTLRRYWAIAGDAAYARTTGLGNVYLQNFSPNTFVFSGQASRAIGRNLSAYASYTLEKQSGVGSGSIFDVFSGSFQVIGVGITYAPPAIRFGPH